MIPRKIFSLKSQDMRHRVVDCHIGWQQLEITISFAVAGKRGNPDGPVSTYSTYIILAIT